MTITYIDTRSTDSEAKEFTRALIEGLAPSGGLYVPKAIPALTLDDLKAQTKASYPELAAWVYTLFEPNIDSDQIHQLIQQAYGDNFDSEEICPITSLNENTHILELWHGPTSAFKDMALQCLPLFLSKSLELEGEEKEFLILVATSGDTGKAALEGFKEKKGIKVSVLYPHQGVSDIQYRQMATQQGNNVAVWAVRGNFDDCQTCVKEIFNDQDFAQKLALEAQTQLTSANSINWGRLLPQVVYYIASYIRLCSQGKLEWGAPLDVCVPTGNFGNILAAYYAKRMGVPIDQLFCASNENRVLTDFINTGAYDISDREFKLTPSPSMDILVSSNLERQLFELTGRDGEKITAWMKDLKESKRFKVDTDTFTKMREHFKSDSVSNEDCLETIGAVHKDFSYVLDPHTAVAYTVAERLRGENPVLIASTAHWAKFGSNVARGLLGLKPGQELSGDFADLSELELNQSLATHFNLTVPANLAELASKEIRFSQVLDRSKDKIEAKVLEFAAN